MDILDNQKFTDYFRIKPTTVLCGRLAPSPTGLLHLGNAWSFWVAWLAARASSGTVVLRIEDIDPDRSKSEYTMAILQDLSWLGLDWDCGPDKPKRDMAFRQSERLGVYGNAVEILAARNLVYPCYCTRKDLREIAGAPHVGDTGASYPGTCRNLDPEGRVHYERLGRSSSLRLKCPSEILWEFEDGVIGRQRKTLSDCGGDFALRRSDGVYAYQLAVVVDDIAMGVTQIVRGRDIVASTPRQLYLYSLFGIQPPQYAHVPLVLDAAGDRLAKRHSSLSLKSLREAGVQPETLLGWLAAVSGLQPDFAPLAIGQIPEGFTLKKIRPKDIKLPPDPVTYFLALQKK